MVLGVSCDSPAENKAFRDKFDFPYDLLCDVDREMSVAYGAASDAGQKHPARISYLIGSDGTVTKAYLKVKPADHPSDVLADLG